jgi:hypothetical protein
MEPGAPLLPVARHDHVGKAPPCAACMDIRPSPPPQFILLNREVFESEQGIIDPNRENKLPEQGALAAITQSCPGPRSGSTAHVEIA